MRNRRKAPHHCFWNGTVLWGRQTINGQKRRWSLRTDDPKVAAERVKNDRERALAAAHYGDTRISWEEAVIGWAKNHIPNRGIGGNAARKLAEIDREPAQRQARWHLDRRLPAIETSVRPIKEASR